MGVGIVMIAIQEVGEWLHRQQEKATAAAMRLMLAKTMRAAERNKVRSLLRIVARVVIVSPP